MSRALYTFTNKENNQLVDVVEFELLNNPGCRAWQYAVMLNNKSRRIDYVTTQFSTILPTDISQRYINFKKIVRNLSQTEVGCEYDLPESFGLVTQNLMNQLHRHFTNSCATIWNPLYSNYKNLYELNKILHELNKEIHALEKFIPTQNKLTYNKIKTVEIWVRPDGFELGYDIFPYRQYHSYEPADLILDPYILGKTLIESFMCHDDPSSWDTAGHMRTAGGVCMLLGNSRQEIYNSDAFNNWLADYGIEKQQSMADFPLGNFVPGHKDKLVSLFGNQGNNLHNYSCQVDIRL